MRKVKILRTVIDVIWVILILVVVISIIGLLYLIFNRDVLSSEIKIKEIPISKLTNFQVFVISVLSSVNLLVLYCFYLFRQVVHSFDNLKIFNEKVIKNFSVMGQILVFVGLVNLISMFLYATIINLPRVIFTLETDTIGFIALGLFCSVLSEVFKISKKLKQENDLTI